MAFGGCTTPHIQHGYGTKNYRAITKTVESNLVEGIENTAANFHPVTQLVFQGTTGPSGEHGAHSNRIPKGCLYFPQ
jgi:hypothetical protein